MNRRNFLRSLATAALAAAARVYPLAQTAITKPFERELGPGAIYVDGRFVGHCTSMTLTVDETA